MPNSGLSIFIVNYNGASFISECLDSLFLSRTTFPFEVILVDNASVDDSLTVLKAYEDRVRVIASSDNLGFSAGNNLAATYAVYDTYFLLNNDTVLPENCLQVLYDFLVSHPDAGAITPKLLNADGSLQAPGGLLGRYKFFKTEPCKVSFIAGAAVMIPKSTWERIGGLDPNLFFYNDDIDMCKMLLKHGYSIYYVPTASLTHYGGLSTRSRKLGSLIEGYRGGLYVCYKHYGPIVYFFYRIFVLVDLIPRLLFHLCLSLFSLKHRQYAKAYLEVLRIDFTSDIFLEAK